MLSCPQQARYNFTLDSLLPAVQILSFFRLTRARIIPYAHGTPLSVWPRMTAGTGAAGSFKEPVALERHQALHEVADRGERHVCPHPGCRFVFLLPERLKKHFRVSWAPRWGLGGSV